MFSPVAAMGMAATIALGLPYKSYETERFWRKIDFWRGEYLCHIPSPGKGWEGGLGHLLSLSIGIEYILRIDRFSKCWQNIWNLSREPSLRQERVTGDPRCPVPGARSPVLVVVLALCSVLYLLVILEVSLMCSVCGLPSRHCPVRMKFMLSSVRIEVAKTDQNTRPYTAALSHTASV